MEESEKPKLSKELKNIKKLYGEDFMHLCRVLFPTLLEKEGLLSEILKSNFATNSRSLSYDIKHEGLEEEFKDFIYSKIDIEKEEIEIIEDKTPYQLLDEAGYDLYECKTEEEIQSFRKYYAHGEELCTFRGNRLDRCVVFWAVKKDVEDIKRENFDKPRREDEYGTSVMSIQFSRGENSTVSIKNRYNHRVNNPDATYGNDLDKIAIGLRKSFTKLLKERGMNLDSNNVEEFSLPNYVVANDGKHYKYNMEVNGIYYCPGNIIIDHGEIIQLEPEKQILIDNFVLDKVEKKIKLFDKNNKDSFLDSFNEIENIDIRKKEGTTKGERIITINTKDSDSPIEIEVDRDNNIISYKNENLVEVGKDFLYSNKGLTKLEAPNLIKVGDNFLTYNEEMETLKLPNLRETGECFFSRNTIINELELPKLERVGDVFLYCNTMLTKLDLPNLKEVGYSFLSSNLKLSKLNLPNLEKAGDDFLKNNIEITELEFPNLRETGNCFLVYCQAKTLEAPKLEKVGNDFFETNREIRELEFPNLRETGSNFLSFNKKLEMLCVPNLEKVGDNFISDNYKLASLEAENLKKVGNRFLVYNKELDNLNLPNLEETGACFVSTNEKISNIEMPKLRKVDYEFLKGNKGLTKVNLPNLEEVGRDFLYSANELCDIELPKLKQNGKQFLSGSKHVGQNIRRLVLPKNILEEEEKLKRIVEFNNGELIETESTDNVIDILKKNINKIGKKDIAKLGQETGITTTEVNFGKRFLNKIKELFKRKESDQRGEK